MIMEEMYMFRVFERSFERKRKPVKEEECWRIRTNRGLKNILQGEYNENL
jgi:hypothetical protein